MLLNADEIRELMRNGVIQGARESNVNAASLDLTLGRFLLKEKASFHTLRLGRRDPMITEKVSCEFGYVLYPNEFILAQTQEVFNLPDDICAEYVLNSSMARCGLDHLLAGFCDPGWNGSVLTMELKNVSRYHAIQIREGDRIGQMKFYRIRAVSKADSYATRGAYNGDLLVSATKPRRSGR